MVWSGEAGQRVRIYVKGVNRCAGIFFTKVLYFLLVYIFVGGGVEAETAGAGVGAEDAETTPAGGEGDDED